MIPEEKPGMPVCHRAKSASGSNRGPVRVEPKRPCRLQKLGDPRITNSAKGSCSATPRGVSMWTPASKATKVALPEPFGAHTMSVYTPSVFSLLWFLLSWVYTSIPHFWNGDI